MPARAGGVRHYVPFRAVDVHGRVPPHPPRRLAVLKPDHHLGCADSAPGAEPQVKGDVPHPAAPRRHRRPTDGVVPQRSCPRHHARAASGARSLEATSRDVRVGPHLGRGRGAWRTGDDEGRAPAGVREAHPVVVVVDARLVPDDVPLTGGSGDLQRLPRPAQDSHGRRGCDLR